MVRFLFRRREDDRTWVERGREPERRHVDPFWLVAAVVVALVAWFFYRAAVAG
jgi:hypothetical protein